jgi:hypothetical protein
MGLTACYLAASRQKSGGLAAERPALLLRNKSPKWNEQLNAYCLNFHGRVTQPSVKNFQLAAEDDLDRVLLQFGKARAWAQGRACMQCCGMHAHLLWQAQHPLPPSCSAACMRAERGGSCCLLLQPRTLACHGMLQSCSSACP